MGGVSCQEENSFLNILWKISRVSVVVSSPAVNLLDFQCIRLRFWEFPLSAVVDWDLCSFFASATRTLRSPSTNYFLLKSSFADGKLNLHLSQSSPFPQRRSFPSIDRHILPFARFAGPRKTRPIVASHAARCQDVLLLCRCRWTHTTAVVDHINLMWHQATHLALDYIREAITINILI